MKKNIKYRNIQSGGLGFKFFMMFFLVSFITFNALNLTSSSVVGAGSDDELYFTIMHTNDEHSALIPNSPAIDYHPEVSNKSVGGFARLASAIKDVREKKYLENEPSILLSAGDHIGGTMFGWLIPEGINAEITLMQKMGYDATIIGNHEFDYGTEGLADYYKKAGYPESHEITALLSANVTAPDEHPLKDIGIKKTLIKELDNGLKVGIFGLLGNDASNETPFFEPLIHSDAFETAAECVAELQEKGVNVIVALTHSGIREDRELAEKVPGIDIIIGGHDHYKTDPPEEVNGVIITQAQSFARYLGVLELAYNNATGKVRLCNSERGNPFFIPIEHPIEPDPEIYMEVEYYTGELNRLVEKYTQGLYSGIMDTVVYSDFPLYASRTELREMELGNFLTDAMRIVTGQILGKKVDFAFQATGVIRAEVAQGSYPHSMNQISFYDLMGASPLGMGFDDIPGYPVAAAYLNGAEVHKILEISSLLSEYMGYEYFMQVSGLRYEYDRDRTIYFWIPGANIPVPSTSSVLKAERFIPEGLQSNAGKDYEKIEKNKDELYLIATDYALLTAIPLVAERIPWLRITPKDEWGNPVEDFADLIVYDNDKELKVWQALLTHAANQPPDSDLKPWLDDYYRNHGERIVEVQGPSIYITPLIIIFIFIILIILLIRLRRKRKGVPA